MSEQAEVANPTDTPSEPVPSVPRRLTASWVPVAFYGFAALRILAVIGLPAVRFGDTSSYFKLDFLGNAIRLWTVPLLFHLVRSDGLRAACQVAIAIPCWWFAARTIAEEMDDALLRLAGIVVVCGFALSVSITSWDVTILSDSLAISLTVLLMALWWRELRRPTRWTAPAIVVVTLFWAFTRQSNVTINHLVLVIVAISIVRARPRMRRAGIALGLLAISLFGQWSLNGNHYVTHVNINALLIERIEPNRSYLQWWLDHGLPHVPKTYSEVDPTSKDYQPDWVRWLDEHGENTYAKFLLTHPDYTLLKPLPDLLPFNTGQLEQPNTSPTVFGLSEHYGEARDVVPRVVTLILVDPGSSGLVLFLGVVAVAGVSLAWRDDEYDARWSFPLLVILINVPQAILLWHGSNGELGRHSLELTITTMLSLWTITLVILDRGVARWRVAGKPVPWARGPV